jgi:hypothetical protein
VAVLSRDSVKKFFLTCQRPIFVERNDTPVKLTVWFSLRAGFCFSRRKMFSIVR